RRPAFAGGTGGRWAVSRSDPFVGRRIGPPVGGLQRGEDGGFLGRPAERRRTGERNELAALEPTCGDEDVGPPVSLDDGSALDPERWTVARLVQGGERRPRGGFRPALD